MKNIALINWYHNYEVLLLMIVHIRNCNNNSTRSGHTEVHCTVLTLLNDMYTAKYHSSVNNSKLYYIFIVVSSLKDSSY